MFSYTFDLYFLQLGVSIEVADVKGCTPLIVASQYGQTMLVGYLIGKGASLFVTDREGDTALHWAAFKGDLVFLCNCQLNVLSFASPHQYYMKCLCVFSTLCIIPYAYFV